MATVFLARDEKDDQAVAVKALHPELAIGLAPFSPSFFRLFSLPGFGLRLRD